MLKSLDRLLYDAYAACGDRERQGLEQARRLGPITGSWVPSQELVFEQ